MAKVIRFDSPVDVNKTQMLDYYANVYGPNEQFVAGYRYQGYSGNAFADSLKDLHSTYPESEGYRIEY